MTVGFLDTQQFWIDRAARTPLLTTEQELFYGKQVQEWLANESPTPRDIRRGQKAKDRMIQSNLKLVISVCKKYSKRVSRTANIEVIDLYQEGVLGLSRAVDKFNPQSGYKFSTYAFWWIQQIVRRYIETYSTTIRTSTAAVQLSMRWRYRPEGQTLEQFAKAQGKSIQWVKQYLEGFQRSQTRSLDTVMRNNKENDSDTCLIDFVTSGIADDEQMEYTDILNELQSIPEIKDSLAILELSQEAATLKEIAPLLECAPGQVKKKLLDYSAQIREHIPADLRKRLRGNESNQCVRIKEPIPTPTKELALVNCCSSESKSMPKAISSNGHRETTLEAEAIAVINEVQEADGVEPQAKRRKRRTAAEVAASEEISVAVDGTNFRGRADHIALLIGAMKKA